MANYNGQLNANIIYSALFNMIISQRIYDIPVAEPTLANKLRVDGTLYGDTKLYYSTDIGKTYVFDPNASSALLASTRNNTTVVDKVTLDQKRQTAITVDYFFTKQAFDSDNTFSQFNGVLLSTLATQKKVFDNGYVNTFIGTTAANTSANAITITVPASGQANTNVEIEAINRITAELITQQIANLADSLKDNERKYNPLGYMRSYNLSDFDIVWNAAWINQIKNVDLPTVYHKDSATPYSIDSDKLTSKWFGSINTAATAGGNNVYSLIEQDIGANHYYPGDNIPSGTAPANTSYTSDPTVLAVILHKESIPFMSGFETATSFFDAQTLRENHWLTWSYNTLKVIQEYPFIVIKVVRAT